MDGASADDKQDQVFDILDHQELHRGFHTLERYTVRQRRLDGGWTSPLKREVYKHRASAGILLHDPIAGQVVLVEQPRLPARVAGRPGRMIQVVAGMIDPGETAETTAIRESEEEARCRLITPPRLVTTVMTTPGTVTELCSLFYGEVDASAAGKVGGLAEEQEETSIVVMPVSEMAKALETGRIFDGVTSVLGWWLQAQLATGKINAPASRPATEAP